MSETLLLAVTVGVVSMLVYYLFFVIFHTRRHNYVQPEGRWTRVRISRFDVFICIVEGMVVGGSDWLLNLRTAPGQSVSLPSLFGFGATVFASCLLVNLVTEFLLRERKGL